jgi:predicted dehydrogenase
MAAAALSVPQIVASSVLRKGGAVAPGNRIVMGCIGVGGMGRGDMGAFLGSPDAQVVAVCDVKQTAREAARDQVNAHYGDKGCAEYNHFRDLVARDDIDAVLIASPDHWHVLHALAAVRAGKDVYVEKPLGMSIEEVLTLRDAVRQYGRVFQFGTQQRSMREFRQACELARNGRIGKVHTIGVGVHSGAAERTGLKSFTAQPVPDGFDYDLWIGPAPVAPYIPQRVVNPHWFHISDYSLGYVSGWGIHHIDIAQWGNGTELTGPTEIEGTATFPNDDALCDNPITWDVRYKFANGVSMRFTGSGPGFDGVRHGITFEGTHGWVWVNRGAIEAEPKSLLQEVIDPDEIHLPVSTHHQQNLLDCIRTRARPVANIDVAVRSDTVCQLGWIAFQLQRKLKWDPEKETFIDDSRANEMMKRALRGTWHL